MKGQQMTQLLIGLLVAIIIGLVVIQVLANQITTATTQISVINETHTGAASGAYVLDQTHSQFGVNGNGATAFRVYNTTLNDDWNLTSNYNVSFANGTIFDLRDAAGNYIDTEIGVDYDAFPTTWIDSPITRTLIVFIPLFIAVVLIVAIAGVMSRRV